MEFHAYKEGNSGKENHQTLNQYGLLLFRANGLFFIFYARIRHTRCWLARLPTRRKDLERGNKSLKEKYSLSVEEHTNQTGTLSQVWMELLKGVVISPLFFFKNDIFAFGPYQYNLWFVFKRNYFSEVLQASLMVQNETATVNR